jgi:phosphatidate cytidylyltransferase
MNLIPRVLSGLILVAVVFAGLVVGGVPLDGLVVIAAGLGAWELGGLIRGLGLSPVRWLLILLAAWLSLRFVLPGLLASFEVILPVTIVSGLLAGVILRTPWAGWAASLAGAIWIGVGLGALLGVYHWHGDDARFGLELVGLVVGTVVATDTLAYFVGSAIGRHRFFAAISPRKSLEGAIGGAIGAVILTSLAAPPLLGMAVPAAIGLGALITVSAQGGDLAESALKRQAGAKDSGRMIPGHGGLLDRLDSLLLVGPAVYCFLKLIAFP